MTSELLVMTGVSSFSGAFFADELLRRGYRILGVSNSVPGESNLYSFRLQNLIKRHKSFELINPRNLQKYRGYQAQLFLVHGAYTKNRRSKEFDIEKAMEETFDIIHKIKENIAYNRIIYTGTFSEPDESFGDRTESFNEYSESKALIYKRLLEDDRDCGKFVMPNPIGIYQGKSLITDAINAWRRNEIFILNNAGYVRDWVPIDLLSKSYANFCEKILLKKVTSNLLRPSYYVATNLIFISLVASYFQKFNGWRCKISSINSSLTSEPRIRVNTDYILDLVKDWDEEKWWKEFCLANLNEEVHK